MMHNIVKHYQARDGKPYIELIEMEELHTTIFCKLPNNYMFRRDRPAHWLQRICLWILAKLNCTGGLESVKTMTRRIPVQGQPFELILRSITEMDLTHHFKPAHIYIGAEDFDVLLGSADPIKSALSFRCEDPTLFGVKFTIIPWMRGTLVVPK